MIYCILGMIILFGNSEANVSSTEKHISSSTQNMICDFFSDTHVSCGTFPLGWVKETERNLYLPIDKIPKNIKIFESILMNSKSFLKNTLTVFHTLKNLTEIRLIGILDYFIPDSDEGTSQRKELINMLFDLPNLKVLNLQYLKLDDSPLKLPHKLEKIKLQKCFISRLDLSSNKNLVELNLVANNLKTMPQLSDPPPPLRLLVLSGNPDLEFSVFDIVNLCHLKYLGVGKFNVNSDPTKKYCECVRLKDYLQEFDIIEHEFIQCDNSNGAINCADYPSDEVKKIRRTKCEITKSEEEPQAEIASLDSWFHGYRLAIGFGLVLMVSAIANIGLIVAFRRKSPSLVVTDESAPSVFEEEIEL